ncbi:hypothetical protein QE374_000016 [Microbacterium sp. SORGH_AS428]|uniref:hypothetical protein n=1 Tax=Microbacterium sp. SORGH_AS_0428 TaxID=3041788 RepID=UPI00285D4E5E|nr:hypothetical protein [Microbacterium sp. SORGH_AS_0428]MDR6198107.1 hypothetical protein [Microbacterium sp. SORGH_AS_0428]
MSNAVAPVMSSFDGMRGASDEAVEGMTAKALTFSARSSWTWPGRRRWSVSS